MAHPNPSASRTPGPGTLYERVAAGRLLNDKSGFLFVCLRTGRLYWAARPNERRLSFPAVTYAEGSELMDMLFAELLAVGPSGFTVVLDTGPERCFPIFVHDQVPENQKPPLSLPALERRLGTANALWSPARSPR